jgi:phage baseplate assembly protein V
MREISELSRRLSNLILPGIIKEIDHEAALVRVESGDLETEWLPFFQRRAWGTIDWDPPSPGEACIVLSPGGELAAGFVLTGVYSGSQVSPSNDPNVSMRKFSDDMIYSYDLKSHTLTISRESGLKVRFQCDDLEFNVKTVAIRNEQGELVSLVLEAFDVVTKSKTPTLFGPQLSTENAANLPPISKKIASFKK